MQTNKQKTQNWTISSSEERAIQFLAH